VLKLSCHDPCIVAALITLLAQGSGFRLLRHKTGVMQNS